mmetsp:Transcript_4400/g.4817  ORF Transcript_4400/g.4817 Transcript_4400/m.4817 type:complete len:111 (+) Transcript_4400:310-642(+)
MVKRAAREVQKKAKWKDHETIQNLKFSNHYIHKLLNRYGLRRRRCTRKHQPQVSFQKAETSINLDETGFTYAIGSDYLYLPVRSQLMAKGTFFPSLSSSNTPERLTMRLP